VQGHAVGVFLVCCFRFCGCVESSVFGFCVVRVLVGLELLWRGGWFCFQASGGLDFV